MARTLSARDSGSDPGRTPDPPLPGRLPRWTYALLAYACVGLAAIGVLLPGLPTVPFLLLAGWAAARGSRRLHDWLYRHPRFGAALIDWEQQKAVSTRSKAGAITLLVVSWLIMLWRFRSAWVSIAAGLLFLGVGSFLLSRPAPVREGAGRSHGPLVGKGGEGPRETDEARVPEG